MYITVQSATPAVPSSSVAAKVAITWTSVVPTSVEADVITSLKVTPAAWTLVALRKASASAEVPTETVDAVLSSLAVVTFKTTEIILEFAGMVATSIYTLNACNADYRSLSHGDKTRVSYVGANRCTSGVSNCTGLNRARKSSSRHEDLLSWLVSVAGCDCQGHL
jgi:hypothetical protein